MSKIKYILDNDVFIAALSGGHDNHKTARAWLDKAKPQGWGIAVETGGDDRPAGVLRRLG